MSMKITSDNTKICLYQMGYRQALDCFQLSQARFAPLKRDAQKITHMCY
ncbi:MAG: hypothetical protein NT154_18355 [Verrucomicrobia bacterium]|nr:hypothetical protein [Verrucomicrobiota bacterium]